MKSKVVTLLSCAMVLGTAAFGSGYTCSGTDAQGLDWGVKLYNHTSVETRVPSILVVSNTEQGTLLKREGSEIKKVNRKNTVQFVVEGNRKIDADSVVFQVAHKEGRETLTDGEEVEGQLILVKDEAKEVVSLTCTRYLKN